MRFVKYAIAAIAAFAAMGGSACALDVNKKIAAPAQVLTVWSTISDFCSIKEKLTGSDDASYSYEIVESSLPVKEYSAKLWVEPDERDPGRTVIHWDATFEANGKSDDEAKKIIGDIFMAGLKNIKQKTMPPEGSVGGD